MLKLKRVVAVLATVAMGATVAGCYVMPLNQHPAGGGYTASHGTAIVPVAAVRAPFTARLYPGNKAASLMGPASGLITNPEDGRGQFTFMLGGESFQGEATRASNASKGVANASGNRGGFARCEYMMSNGSVGAGSCLFSGGARYDMHISQ